MSSAVQLPSGYRFRPSKPQIFSSFLIPVVVHGALIPPHFLDLEIYGENKEPWNLFDKHSRESFWVFTTLRKRDNSRSHRKAGSGTWRPWGITTKVLDKQSRVLGVQKNFTFYITTDQPANQDNGHWIMHEYSLNHQNFKYRVICEIKNTGARMCRNLNPKSSIPGSSNRNISDDRADRGSGLILYWKQEDDEEMPNLSDNDDICDIRNQDPEFSPNQRDSNQDDETTAIPNAPVKEIVCADHNLTRGDSDEPSKQDCKKTEESDARHSQRQ